MSEFVDISTVVSSDPAVITFVDQEFSQVLDHKNIGQRLSQGFREIQISVFSNHERHAALPTWKPEDTSYMITFNMNDQNITIRR